MHSQNNKVFVSPSALSHISALYLSNKMQKSRKRQPIPAQASHSDRGSLTHPPPEPTHGCEANCLDTQGFHLQLKKAGSLPSHSPCIMLGLFVSGDESLSTWEVCYYTEQGWLCNFQREDELVAFAELPHAFDIAADILGRL